MYFPYLRGRQNELLALKKLNENNKLNNIIPIIEPVNISTTLLRTICSLNNNNKKFIIIRNPNVGTFIPDSSKEENAQKVEKIKNAINAENVLSGIIINENSDDVLKELLEQGISYDKIATFCLNSDVIKNFQSSFQNESPIYNIVPPLPAFKRVDKGERIMIADKFTKLPRNSDYLDPKKCDEFFSNDHIYCYEEEYKGFSDYSIVGSEYSDSGFAPYAIAIHIVYFDENKYLRIHHFVSDSNDDPNDPAKKFYQALTKLVDWNKAKGLDTLAIKEFESMYSSQKYSGLGVIKKLSIMHHIELIDNYLNEK